MKVWSSGKLATENPIFFKSPSSEKVFLIHGKDKTELSTVPVGGEWQGEFRVSLAGAYTLKSAKDSYTFEVEEYQRLGVQYELLFTVLAVALFFLVLAFKRRKVYEAR